MFDKIIFAMRKSLKYTTLDVQRLGANKTLRDLIKCTSLGKLTTDQIDDAQYMSKSITDNISLMYVFVEGSPKSKLSYDLVDRMGKTLIVIYRYSDFPEDDDAIISRLFLEAEKIIIGVYGSLYSTFYISTDPFSKFDRIPSRMKLVLLSPYMIVCKIFEGVNIGFHTGGNFTLQKALNPKGIEQVDKVINFILKEEPDVDTLFNLNAFLLPFAIEDSKEE